MNFYLLQTWNQPVDSNVYQFMTTVSMPIYDRRENAVSQAYIDISARARAKSKSNINC